MAQSIPDSYMLAVITSVISSGGIWATLQAVMSRRLRKAETVKTLAEADKARREVQQKAEDRHHLLAEAQATAQRTALESAKERYDTLREDYQACRQGLIEIRDATALLINVFETLLLRLRPASEDAETYTAIVELGELGEARRAINEARRHLR